MFNISNERRIRDCLPVNSSKENRVKAGFHYMFLNQEWRRLTVKDLQVIKITNYCKAWVKQLGLIIKY